MNQTFTIRQMVIMGMLVAVCAVCAQIAIPLPFSPVPFTMQTLAVLLIGLLLSPKYALITIIVYVICGAVGMPVFAQAKAGLGAIAGPTGGFIWGFILAVPLVSYLAHSKGFNWKKGILASLAGLLILYIAGIIQLSFVAGITPWAAFLSAALPYLPFECIKIAIAIKIALVARKSSYLQF